MIAVAVINTRAWSWRDIDDRISADRRGDVGTTALIAIASVPRELAAFRIIFVRNVTRTWIRRHSVRFAVIKTSALITRASMSWECAALRITIGRGITHLRNWTGRNRYRCDVGATTLIARTNMSRK